jgi:hypothetical protein
MSLADPQSLTLLTVPYTLARVSVNGQAATYATADEALSMLIQHILTKAKRKRHEVKVTWTKVVTNPIDSSTDSDSTTLSFVIDRPPFGFTESDIVGLVSSFSSWIGTSGLVAKLYGSQS